MKEVFNLVTLVFVLIIFLKVILWLKTDFPIDRKSVLFLLVIVFLLQFRNRITYILLLIAMVYPFFHRHYTAIWSGSTFEEFTYSIVHSMNWNSRYWNVKLLNLPYFLYVSVVILLLFPQTMRLHGYLKGRMRTEKED